jgi:hypothetical protein
MGAVSAIAWLTRYDDTGESICYATFNGWIVILRYEPSEVSGSVRTYVVF